MTEHRVTIFVTALLDGFLIIYVSGSCSVCNCEEESLSLGEVALYLKTYAESSANAAQAAGSGDVVGVVKTATMGDTSVSYDNSAVTAGTEKWGTWNATQYGAQLVTMARGLGIAGSFVI